MGRSIRGALVPPLPGAAHQPPGLTLTHVAFLTGVFLVPFHLRLAALNFTVAGWFLVLLRTQRATVDPSHRELLAAFLASTIHMFIPLMLQRQYWLTYGLGLAWALHTTAWHAGPSPVRFVGTQEQSYAR